MQQNTGLQQLIYLFSRLPGLGTRSARRIVLHLLQDKDIRLKGLIDGLELAAQKIKTCQNCGNIDYAEICSICADPRRSDDAITIVETVAELWALERSESFQGKYHVLGNIYSQSMLQDPNLVRLPALKQRCHENSTQELIIATNATLDGQTMAYFITEFFRDYPIKISRLASGIPVGGELDYLDEGTLSAAFESRKLF